MKLSNTEPGTSHREGCNTGPNIKKLTKMKTWLRNLESKLDNSVTEALLGTVIA